MTLTVTTVAGKTDPVSLVSGEQITQTLAPVWQAHVAAHLDRCGRVHGPLRDWVCREGHLLWGQPE